MPVEARKSSPGHSISLHCPIASLEIQRPPKKNSGARRRKSAELHCGRLSGTRSLVKGGSMETCRKAVRCSSQITNTIKFSYHGYYEILTGFADSLIILNNEHFVVSFTNGLAVSHDLNHIDTGNTFTLNSQLPIGSRCDQTDPFKKFATECL